MGKVRQLGRLVNQNRKALAEFEIVFKLLTFLVAVPLFSGGVRLTMKMTGYRYLTVENILFFVIHPVTIVSFLALLLLMTAYTMFDIATVIIILDQSCQNRKVRLPDVVRLSARKCAGMLHLKSLSLTFFTLFLIPFLNLGLASGVISTIQVPGFIQDYIQKNHILLVLCIALVALLAVLLLRWLYSLHYLVLEDIPFKEARRRSRRLGAKRHVRDLLSLVAMQLVISLGFLGCVLIGILLIMAVDGMLERFVLLNSLVSTIIWMFIALSAVVFMSLSMPIGYAGISVLFYAHKREQGEEIRSLRLQERESGLWDKSHMRAVCAGIAIVALILGVAFTYGLQLGKYNLNIEYARTTEVTAHRGASVDYPENTMSAFAGASELGADWIELDVQQTKDGQIIVIHDTNFKRTTGVNRNTWELTCDEVSRLDAGNLFGEEHAGERIPLLAEAVEFAKENLIKLNIELKPTGHETDFEKTVVDIVTEYDFLEECVITSQVYHVLENVKDYNPDAVTVYVMSLAYGDITALEAADHFSVEAANVTENLVTRVHGEGKQLYAWTVNTEAGIRKMVELNVDNVITDNVTLAKETIYAEKTSDLISEYIKLLEKIF
ncbi:MAG: hypothetical protein HFH95_01965 [Lachnospiraceae bacterium]|nr:glycerophosphoryl diester phosphodiesterase membrane domain-containing protein [uncultured Acetatifactor sp.]MCI8542077.1 hypothetical protein [Lachnospiraceae bacterium]